MGSSKKSLVLYRSPPYTIRTSSGVLQPFAVWKGDRIERFTETLAEAMDYCKYGYARVVTDV